MKKIMFGVMVLCLVFTFAGTSMAANEWDKGCNIAQIGVAGTDDQVFKVSNCDKSAHNDKWLQLVNQKDTGMATLLTAMSLSKKVKINADFASATTTGSAYGAVEVLYLSN